MQREQQTQSIKHLYQLLWSLYIVVRYIVEESLENFHFWSGAKSNAELLTSDEFETIEDYINDGFCEDPTDTAINDLFWFDFDYIWESVLGHSIIDENYVRSDDVINADETPIVGGLTKDLIIERLKLSDDEIELLNTMFDKFYKDNGANTVNGIIEEIEEAMSDNEDKVTEREQWLLDSIKSYIEDHNNLLFFNDCIAD